MGWARVPAVLGVVALAAAAIAITIANPTSVVERESILTLVFTVALLGLTGAALYSTLQATKRQITAARDEATRQIDAAQALANEDRRQARETATQQIDSAKAEAIEDRRQAQLAADREIEEARRQTQIAEERARRAEEASHRADLLLEPVIGDDQIGYPRVQPAPTDAWQVPSVQRFIEQRQRDHKHIQRVDLAVTNLGPGHAFRFQARWLTLSIKGGPPDVGYLALHDLPYERVVRSGDSVPLRLWFDPWVDGPTQSQVERVASDLGVWRDVGIMTLHWQDGLGGRHESTATLALRFGGSRGWEVKLDGGGIR